MGTLDFMAPEIYQMKCEKEHPIYTKKIDLFALGQSILVLMGFIKKAKALNSFAINELRENCTLFQGTRKEKMLADLVFNHLLIIDPEKRDDWSTYFKHQIFEDNVFNPNEIKNSEENLVRIENRLIKRKSVDNYRNITPNSEKIEIKNNLEIKKIKPFINSTKNEKTNENVLMNNYKPNSLENFNLFNKNTKDITIDIKNDIETDKDKISDTKDKLEEDTNLSENTIRSINNNTDTFSIINNNNIILNNNNNINNRINEKENDNISDKMKNTNKIIYNKEKKEKGKEKVLPYTKISYNNTNKKQMPINYNKNKIELNLTTLPFDLDNTRFEKKKTYTSQNVKSLITNIENDIPYNFDNRHNKRKKIDRYINDKKDNLSQILNISTTKKSPTNIKIRNRSNINRNLINFKNKRGFETHNHFYSVSNKFKRHSLKDNYIKNSFTNIHSGLQNKDKYIRRKSKEFNISQNISPKNNKNYTGNKNIGDEVKNKYYNNIKNRKHIITKIVADNNRRSGRKKSRDIKYFKLKMNLEPKNRHSRSKKKYSKDKNNKNNSTVNSTEINNNNSKLNEYIKKKYNINNDVNGNVINCEANNGNQISYILNNTNCPKNKSITYFNIRVVDKQVAQGNSNNHKINKNNAFHFSKYSRYKNNK